MDTVLGVNLAVPEARRETVIGTAGRWTHAEKSHGDIPGPWGTYLLPLECYTLTCDARRTNGSLGYFATESTLWAKTTHQ